MFVCEEIYFSMKEGGSAGRGENDNNSNNNNGFSNSDETGRS
jgi:hypothetical protein